MTQVSTTQGNGMAKAAAPQSLKGLLGSEDIRRRFEEIMGEKAPGFISSILNIVNGNNNLQLADPKSVIMAAGVAATLDLPINPNLGFAFIIPYQQSFQVNGQWQSKQVAQFQMGYKGFIQLAKRSGQYLKINALEVRAGQLKRANPLTEDYDFDFNVEGGEIIGFVVYFKELNGFEKTIYWNVGKMNEHAKRYSKSFGKSSSPWKTNYVEMGCKTLLKLALSKYGTLSIELQKAFSADQAVVNGSIGNEQFEYADHEDLSEQQSISANTQDQATADQPGQSGETPFNDGNDAPKASNLPTADEL